MGRNNRKRIEQEQRRTQVAKMCLAGHTQASIASVLGVSQGTVSKDLAAVRREWREQRLKDIEDWICLQFEALRATQFASWESYDLSCKDSVKQTVRVCGRYRTETITTQTRDGDARFLKCVLRCIDRQCELLGLYPPPAER